MTNSWEQRKLTDIASIQKGEQINKSVLLDEGNYYVLNGGMTPSGYTNSYNTNENTISISEGGNSCGFIALNTEKFWSGGHNYTLLGEVDVSYPKMKEQSKISALLFNLDETIVLHQRE